MLDNIYFDALKISYYCFIRPYNFKFRIFFLALIKVYQLLYFSFFVFKII